MTLNLETCQLYILTIPGQHGAGGEN